MKHLVALLALAMVLYSCKSGGSGSPKDTISSFIKAAREGNLTELKKYISRSDVNMLEIGENMLAKFDPNGSKGMKDKIMKQMRENTKDAKVEIKDEKIDGDNATVNVEFASNGKTEIQPFTLVKEEGQWKISLLTAAMKNSGAKPEDIQKAMKNINIDSLKGALSEGMQELDKMDKDSLKKVTEEGMKEAMKELKKLKDSLKKE